MQVLNQLFQNAPQMFKITLEYCQDSTKIWANAIETCDVKMFQFGVDNRMFKISYFADLMHRHAFKSNVGFEYFTNLLVQNNIELDYESMLRAAIVKKDDVGFMRVAKTFEKEIVHEIKNVNQKMLIHSLRDTSLANMTQAVMFLVDKCGIDITSHDFIVLESAIELQNTSLIQFCKDKSVTTTVVETYERQCKPHTCGPQMFMDTVYRVCWCGQEPYMRSSAYSRYRMN